MAPREDIGRLLSPRSVAVIGASEGTMTGGVIRNLLKLGFGGQVFPVNPRRERVYELPCYPSIDDIPEQVDHVVLGIPAASIPDTLEGCARKGIQEYTVIAAGFGERGEEGRRLQDRLKAIAKAHDLRMVGPNCYGFINLLEHSAVCTGSFPTDLYTGNVAGIFQSGGLMTAVIRNSRDAGIGFSYLISSGNEAVTNKLDYLEFLIDEPHTEVVMMFMEGLQDPGRLLKVAARAAELEKPIVLLRLGKTERGKRAALSHTGSLAQMGTTEEGILRQFGIVLVESVAELVETALLFSHRKFPAQVGACTFSVSGGLTGWLAERGELEGIEFASWTEEQRKAFTEAFPFEPSVENPMDVGAGGTDLDVMKQCLEIAAQGPNTGIISLMRPISGGDSENEIRGFSPLRAVARQYPEKLFVLLAACTNTLSHRPDLLQEWKEIVVLQNIEQGVKAIRSLQQYAKFLQGFRERRVVSEAHRTADPWSSQHKETSDRPQEAAWPSPEAFRFLEEWGLPVAQWAFARSLEELYLAIKEIGYPVVLKLEALGLTHKSDVGAVRLNVSSDAEVERTYNDFQELASSLQQPFHGVLVQEHAPASTEIILGLVRRPGLGMVVMAGLGGIFTEVLKDVAFRLAPITELEAFQMLRELRAYPVLEGVRGQKDRDVDAIIDTLVKLGRVAEDRSNGVVEQLDINPLIVYEQSKGVKIVDCLVVAKHQ